MHRSEFNGGGRENEACLEWGQQVDFDSGAWERPKRSLLPTYLLTQLPKGTRPIWLCWYNCAQWKMISIKNKIHKIFNPLLISHETHFDDGNSIDYRAWSSTLKELGRQNSFSVQMPTKHCFNTVEQMTRTWDHLKIFFEWKMIKIWIIDSMVRHTYLCGLFFVSS